MRDDSIDEPPGELLSINAVAQSFFNTLKVERVHRQTYMTREHARVDIVNWLEGFYDRYRLHSSIGFQSPVDAQASLMAA